MANLFKRPTANPTLAIRETLFGDMSIAEWTKNAVGTSGAWESFVLAGRYLDANDPASARRELQKILVTPGLESRHYLQAWHFLRPLGVKPDPDEAKKVYGVVVEVGMKDAGDILAAYADHSARYLNHAGSAVIWERPDQSLDAEIDRLIAAGQAVARVIGPWDQARPGMPPADYLRLNMLTPSGLHFGYGIFKQLERDRMARSVIDPATALMLSLMARAKPTQ
jgi:hypothetical protein